MLRTFVLRTDGNAKALWGFLKSNWASCAQQGKPLAVTVSEHKSKRSVDQNKRLHAILQAIAEQAWVGSKQYPMETWKEAARRRLIGTEEVDLPDGTRMERGISTTTLDVAAFSEMMDRLEAWAVTELGVEL